MIRPFETFVVFVATLTAAVQPTLAGGHGPAGGHSIGGSVSRPAVRAPAAAPRINRATSPAQIQPAQRNSVTGTKPGAIQNATPAISPKNGTQTGIINRGQTPDAARNPIAGGNLNKNLGSTTLPGTASSALDNIRRRINDGGLPGMSASARAGADRHLTAQHHEHHDGDSHCDDETNRVPREPAPGSGGGSNRVPRQPDADNGDGSQRVSPQPAPHHVSPTTPSTGRTPPPVASTPSAPSHSTLPHNDSDGPVTPPSSNRPTAPQAPPHGSSPHNDSDQPVTPPSPNGPPPPATPSHGSSPQAPGTVVGDERKPLSNPPVPTPDDHRHVNPLPNEPHGKPIKIPRNNSTDGQAGQGGSDLTQIVGAISGLVGAIGSGGGSGGGDGGSVAPADGDFSEAPAAAPQPAPAELEVATASQPIERTDVKKLDIELTDVRLVDAGNFAQKTGPRFRLYYRNSGTVNVPKFNVTVMVDAGLKLTESAEIVTVEAVGLKPGKVQSIDVRLPVEVLTMGTDKDGKPAGFGILAAMLDSDESLDETDEENNVLMLARDEIKSAAK